MTAQLGSANLDRFDIFLSLSLLMLTVVGRHRLRQRRAVRRHRCGRAVRRPAEHVRQAGRRPPRPRGPVRVPGQPHAGAARAHGREHRPQPHRRGRADRSSTSPRCAGREPVLVAGIAVVGRRLPAGPQRHHQQLVAHRRHGRGRGGHAGSPARCLAPEAARTRRPAARAARVGGSRPDVPLELVGVARPYTAADREMLDARASARAGGEGVAMALLEARGITVRFGGKARPQRHDRAWSSGARSPGSSGPTAPARPRCSTSCAGC